MTDTGYTFNGVLIIIVIATLSLAFVLVSACKWLTS